VRFKNEKFYADEAFIPEVGVFMFAYLASVRGIEGDNTFGNYPSMLEKGHA